MVRLRIGIASILVIFVAGCDLHETRSNSRAKLKSLQEPNPPHEEYVKRFRTIVQEGFQAPTEEIRAAFSKCFREGDSAWDYEDILSTAQMRKCTRGEKGELVYTWSLARDDTHDMEVYVSGYPPVIVHHEWIEWLH
jgi:arginyl-tRNA synthetase